MATTSVDLIPPPAETLENLLSLSASHFDKLCLRFMNRMFMSTRSTDEGFQAHIDATEAFYARSGRFNGPGGFFVDPGHHDARVEELGRLPDGKLLELTFDSGFTPHFPDFLEEHSAYLENRQIHAWHLMHSSPRPTLVYVHGWAGGFPGFEMRLVPLRAVYDQGYDVLLFTLPYHGARTPRQALFGGQLFPCPRIDRTNEGFAHAIHDLRVTLRYLREVGRGPIGLMGFSLGAYVSTLLAGLGESIELLMLMIPLADLPELLWAHGEGNPDRVRAERLGLTLDRLKELYALHAPLRLAPTLPPERVLILAGRGDAICPRSQTEMLWRHFDQPRVHWFPGSHVAHFGRAQLAKSLADFSRQWFEVA